jgi:general secretion pathway protein H
MASVKRMKRANVGAAPSPAGEPHPGSRRPPNQHITSNLNRKKNRKHNLESARGFTLIELMVVMMLISIILAVAIPRFEGGFLQDPIKKFSRKMIGTVRSLRFSALQTQTQQTLMIDLDAQELYVEKQAAQAETTSEDETPSDSETASDSEATSESPAKRIKLPDSLALVAVEFSETESITNGIAQIHFYPAGYSDHAFIRLQSSADDRYTYVVQPLLPKVKLFEEWIDF